MLLNIVVNGYTFVIHIQEKQIIILCKLIGSLSRYWWSVKLPPQNSARVKKLGGSPAARKRPFGEG
ncbi:hypothetical protein CDB3_08190 [Bacillus sp. CDB3]|nr:hypothetical protein CDB3_08190 [Bacillus sp. CDB3]